MTSMMSLNDHKQPFMHFLSIENISVTYNIVKFNTAFIILTGKAVFWLAQQLHLVYMHQDQVPKINICNLRL